MQHAQAVIDTICALVVAGAEAMLAGTAAYILLTPLRKNRRLLRKLIWWYKRH